MTTKHSATQLELTTPRGQFTFYVYGHDWLKDRSLAALNNARLVEQDIARRHGLGVVVASQASAVSHPKTGPKIKCETGKSYSRVSICGLLL